MSDAPTLNLTHSTILPRLGYSPIHLPATDWTLFDLYQRMEMPIVPLVDRMMATGMRIDPVHMGRLHEYYQAKMEEHSQAAAALVGRNVEDLNLGSPDQVAVILFDHLRLRPPKLTPGGKPSTEEKGLEVLKDSLPVDSIAYQFMDHLFEYRGYSKLDSTYCDKAIRLRDEKDFIYTTIKQTRTASGRLSSAEPFNFQNFPSRDEEAKEFRKGFLPPDGYVIMKLDFSQIELRVLAHNSHDPNMMIAFVMDHDLHTVTARKIFHLRDEVEPSKGQRTSAKVINFGIPYGLTDRGMVPKLPKESRNIEFAQGLIAEHKKAYPGVHEHIEDVQTWMRRYHWVADQWGRRRSVPEVTSMIRRKQEEGLREGFNHTIQAGAQGAIKMPMGYTLPAIEMFNLDVLPYNQIHDEVDLYVRKDQVRATAEVIGEIYACAVKLDVPVKVEIEVGENWGEVEKVLCVNSI